MQEEVEQKTVNLAVTTTKLIGRVAVKAIAWSLRHRKEKKFEKVSEIPHTKSKIAATEEEREEDRQKYLDEIGIHPSFRW